MTDLVRLSISIEKPLHDQMERIVKESGYQNRSEFVRDLIRDCLVKEQWKQNQNVVGTITLIYNHHSRLLSANLTHLQHDHHEMILSTTHVHLDHEMCAEVIIVRGKASRISNLANLMQKQKGVLHLSLSMSSAGKDL
jgi:CopG family transcriptional regulator, nickel-responsive regulator